MIRIGFLTPYQHLPEFTEFAKSNFKCINMVGLSKDKLNIFKQELQELDIDLLPPNINKSGRDFKVNHFGLCKYIKETLAPTVSAPFIISPA